MLERTRVVAELCARLAGLEPERGSLRIVGPLGQHGLVEPERLLVVGLGAGLARVAVMLTSRRGPCRLGELGARRTCRVGRLGLVPLAPRRELRRELEPRRLRL